MTDNQGRHYRWNKAKLTWEEQPLFDRAEGVYAWFAELNKDTEVIWLTQILRAKMMDENREEKEELGIEYCKELFDEESDWRQSGDIRNEAQIGWFYNAGVDRFLPPKPFPSWILNDQYEWVAPIPYPNDGADYRWDEDTHSWIKFTKEENIKQNIKE